MLKTFAIMIDEEVNPQIITQFMRENAEIQQWWHHLPNAYIVTTELDANALSRMVHKLAGEGSFLVVAVDLGQSAGFLPTSAWKWIKRRESEGVGSVSAAHEL